MTDAGDRMILVVPLVLYALASACLFVAVRRRSGAWTYPALVLFGIGMLVSLSAILLA